MDWDLQPGEEIRSDGSSCTVLRWRARADRPLDEDGIGAPAENIGVGSFWSHWTSL
jgi:hypothetical protein